MKIIRGGKFALLLILLILLYWQYDYEFFLYKLKTKCSIMHNKKRINFTPVFIYRIKCMIYSNALKKDRYCGKVIIEKCAQIETNGYLNSYFAHSYISEIEKDSILGELEMNQFISP